MFNFGDELIIESYRIPWLIWIQLLVMLLLIILLYIFALDLSQDPDTASSSSTVLLSSSIIDRPKLSTTVASCFHHTKVQQVGEDESKKGDDDIGGGTTRGRSRSRRRRILVGEENIQERERECSSTKDPTNVTLIQPGSHHPCHFLGLATQAFLKCFGFDSTTDNPSSNTRQGKDR